jgi:hypothetical protein
MSRRDATCGLRSLLVVAPSYRADWHGVKHGDGQRARFRRIPPRGPQRPWAEDLKASGLVAWLDRLLNGPDQRTPGNAQEGTRHEDQLSSQVLRR